MAKMTDDDFSTMLDAQIDDAASWQRSNLAPDRERAYRAYLGMPDGNEVPGRSQVVSWDVFETIEAAMPDLIEVFCAGDNIAEFEPTGPEDEQFADQATDYINYVVQKQNAGFLLFSTWIKDALLSKQGVVRAYWAEKTSVRTVEYRAINDMQLTKLMESDEGEVTVIESESTPDEKDAEQRAQVAQVINTLAPDVRMQAEAYLASKPAQNHDVKLRIKRTAGRVYIDNVQPENFIVSRRAKTLEAADLVGEFRSYSRSDLVELGYSKAKAKEVQSYDLSEQYREGVAQYADRDQVDDADELTPDEATEEVRLFDGFIRCDYDDDGIAEWRAVLRGGNIVLKNEPAEEQNFCVISPILIPHRLVGMSLADPVVPMQETNTALTRQYLDALYLANNPRTYVNTEASVNLDDLLDNRIGGIVRGKGAMQMAVSPLVASNPAPAALQGIEFMDARRETRTGITRYNQGLDADSLNKTATGVSKIMSAGDRRKVLMARIMADTGIQALFRLVLRLVCQNQDKAATVRLRGDWVDYDPSPWNPDMDVTVSVGLGTGDKSQLLGTLQMILGVQQTAIQAGVPLATVQNVYNTLSEMLKASGIKGVTKFFQDPSKAPQQAAKSPEPPPEQALAQAQVKAAELQLQGKQMQIQADMQSKQMDMQAEQQKFGFEVELAKVNLQIKQTELQIKQAELGVKQQDADTRRIKVEEDSQRESLAMGADLIGRALPQQPMPGAF